jgi:hypothetical protein
VSLFLVINDRPRFAFPRSYVGGLVLDGQFTSGPSYADGVIDYVDQFGITFHIVVRPGVVAWSSNVYTADYVIDVSASHCYIGVVEVIDGVFMTMPYFINDNLPRILLQSGGGTGTQHVFDFAPAPSDYWLNPLT